MRKNLLLLAFAAGALALVLHYDRTKRDGREAVRRAPQPVAVSSARRSPPSEPRPAPTAASSEARQTDKAQAEALAEGLKTFKVGTIVRTHDRLAPFLRQSGLSDAEIDQAVELYVDMVFAKTAEERQVVIDKIKSLLGEEVYDGIEKAEECQRNSVRDEALLSELKASMPQLSEGDLAAAKAGFANLPSYQTLFMQEAKFRQPTAAVVENLRASAEKAFDKAFAQSAISAAAYQGLKASYVATAIDLVPVPGR